MIIKSTVCRFTCTHADDCVVTVAGDRNFQRKSVQNSTARLIYNSLPRRTKRTKELRLSLRSPSSGSCCVKWVEPASINWRSESYSAAKRWGRSAGCGVNFDLFEFSHANREIAVGLLRCGTDTPYSILSSHTLVLPQHRSAREPAKLQSNMLTPNIELFPLSDRVVLQTTDLRYVADSTS